MREANMLVNGSRLVCVHLILLMGAFRDCKAVPTQSIKATDFQFEVRCNLRGHLEATMASEANKLVVRSNMHIVSRVNEVPYFKSEVKFDIRGR